MKEQKELYVVIDENNIITKIFYREIKFEKSKSIWNIRKENFDEDVDFENAVVISPEYLDKIHIGFSKVENGVFIENKEEYENSLKGE